MLLKSLFDAFKVLAQSLDLAQLLDVGLGFLQGLSRIRNDVGGP
jgi:hypothetical protein